MTGLFSWATDALASVTSTVIAPFRGETEPVKAEFHVTNAQPYRKPGGQSKSKKRAQAKKKQQNRQNAAKKIDESDKEEIDGDNPTSPASTPVVDYGPDEHTKLILAKMAEAAEQRALEDKLAEEAELAAIAQREELLANSVVKVMPTDPLELERAEAKQLIRKELAKIGDGSEFEKYDDFQQAVQGKHRELDEIAQRIETTLRAIGKRCPKPPSDMVNMDPKEIRDTIQNEELKEKPNELEIKNLVSALTAVITSLNQKAFFAEMQELINDVSAQRARMLANLEKARVEEARSRAIQRLQILYDSINDSVEAPREHEDEGTGNETTVGDDHEDVPPVKSEGSKEPGAAKTSTKLKLREHDVVGKNHDMVVDYARVAIHMRKLERRFRCVIMPPNRQRATGNRTIKIWGHEQDVDELIAWMKTCDWSGNLCRTYDRRMAGLIVGRGGMTIQQLEKETGCILTLDSGNGGGKQISATTGPTNNVSAGSNANVLIAYGPPEAVAKVWEKVETLRGETRVQQSSRYLQIDARIGRAIMAIHRSKIQAIEDQYSARLNIWLRPEEGAPRIIVRCSNDKLEQVLQEVQKSLIDAYVVLDFEASARAISRLLVPPRLPGPALHLNNEFKSFTQELGLFVQREGSKTEDPGASTQEGEASTSAAPGTAPIPRAALWIVCSAKDKNLVETTVSNLLKKADYQTERISIMREQQRIFTVENRGLIEASSGGCRVSIVNNPNEGTMLMLIGSEECISKGKEIVRDILEREGAVATVQLGEASSGEGASAGPAILEYLLRDRGAVIRSMEDVHAVSIHIDRSTNQAKIVGDRAAIEAASHELADLEKEIARSQEDTIRMVVSLDADKVPLLIGRGGQTISQIRNIPGVQSIEVPTQSQTQDQSVVEIVLLGRTAALEEAQSFIETLVKRSNGPTNSPRRQQQQDRQSSSPAEPVDFANRIANRGGRGRGRGRRQQNADYTEPLADTRASGVPLKFEEDAFPVLGDYGAPVDDA